MRRLLQGDGVLSTQKKVVMMVQVTKPREIIFADRDTGNVSTHLIVPGMVVERYDGKPLGAIDTDPEQVARIINEHGETSASVHVNVSEVGEQPRRTPILPNPRTLLRASVSLCKWQLKAPRHGGRKGGRIKALAAPLPSCGGGGGWRTREARSGATARP